MIITKKYARRLINSGRATIECYVLHDNEHYAAITRYDIQRTDHYPASVSEVLDSIMDSGKRKQQ